MNRFTKNALFSGLGFGAAMSIFFSLIAGPRSGVISGALSGTLFGVGIASFVEIQSRSSVAQTPPLNSNETLLKNGPANHFVGAESVGGWLFLTNQKLFFRSHAFNVQTHELSMPLANISRAQPAMSLFIVPNGLRVITKTGTAEQFVVESRGEWVHMINEVIAQITPTATTNL